VLNQAWDEVVVHAVLEQRGKASARDRLVDLDRAVQLRRELQERQRRTAYGALGAERRQMPPPDQASARIAEHHAWAAARAPRVADHPDPLLAVAQAALVADVPARGDDLEQERRPVLGRAPKPSCLRDLV